MIDFIRSPYGSIIVDPGGANLVRRTYRDYLTGMSVPQIARTLTVEAIPTPRSKQVWSHSTVRSILTNEKYKGDALLQKGFTTDSLTKRRKANEGEVPQYDVTGSHDAIIDPDTWSLVQQQMTEGRAQGKRDHTFTGMITCTRCGGRYGPKLWHLTDKYSRTIWQCNNKYKEPHPGGMPTLTAGQLRDCFQEALAQMVLKRHLVDYDLLHSVLADSADLEERLAETATELEVVTALMEQSITTNATHVQDQEAYRQQFAALEARHGTSRDSYESIRNEIARRQDVGTRLRAFQKTMSGIDQAGEFDPATFHALLDHIEIDADGATRVIFGIGFGRYPVRERNL